MATKAVQAGEIRGVVGYCRPGDLAGTLVHIPGRSFQANVGASGQFILNYVPAGTHSVSIEIPGFVPHLITGVMTRDNEVTDLGTITICRDTDGDSFLEDVDCDDNNPAINPSAFEGQSGDSYVACDGVDNNCNGQVDEGCPSCTDADQDGFCAQAACSGLTIGSVSCQLGVDCDDQNPTISPVQGELCDGADNSCNGQVDDGFDLSSDVNNCGACGYSCSALPGVSSALCSSGICTQLACIPMFGDCNGDLSDGCETNLFGHDNNNCTACGTVCAPGTQCEPAGGCAPCSLFPPGFGQCP